MACGCKNKVNQNQNENPNEVGKMISPHTVMGKISKNMYFVYFFRTLMFLLSVVMLVVVLPYILYVLFKRIVLSKEIDLMDMIKKFIPKKNRGRQDIDNDDDDDDGEHENEFGTDYDDLVDNNGIQIVDVVDLNDKKNV